MIGYFGRIPVHKCGFYVAETLAKPMGVVNLGESVVVLRVDVFTIQLLSM